MKHIKYLFLFLLSINQITNLFAYKYLFLENQTQETQNLSIIFQKQGESKLYSKNYSIQPGYREIVNEVDLSTKQYYIIKHINFKNDKYKLEYVGKTKDIVAEFAIIDKESKHKKNFDERKQLETPVLFLIYNRSDYAEAVLHQIKKVRPKKLFIAADGPKNSPENIKKCEETRKCILENLANLGWECEVHIWLRENNLGCAKAISSAITWFFEHVESGIILEDDCVPNESFFDYCSVLLEKYKDDSRVMMIAGDSRIPPGTEFEFDYLFSSYIPVWGWATWKRAWNFFDYDMKNWKNKKNECLEKMNTTFNHTSITKYFSECFANTSDGITDSWAYRWILSIILNKGLCVIPKKNLISNIGCYGHHGNGRSVNLFRQQSFLDSEKIEFRTNPQKDFDMETLIFKGRGLIR